MSSRSEMLPVFALQLLWPGLCVSLWNTRRNLFAAQAGRKKAVFLLDNSRVGARINIRIPSFPSRLSGFFSKNFFDFQTDAASLPLLPLQGTNDSFWGAHQAAGWLDELGLPLGELSPHCFFLRSIGHVWGCYEVFSSFWFLWKADMIDWLMHVVGLWVLEDLLTVTATPHVSLAGACSYDLAETKSQVSIREWKVRRQIQRSEDAMYMYIYIYYSLIVHQPFKNLIDCHSISFNIYEITLPNHHHWMMDCFTASACW